MRRAINLPHPGDGQALRRYTETYAYDEVGNILSAHPRSSRRQLDAQLHL